MFYQIAASINHIGYDAFDLATLITPVSLQVDPVLVWDDFLEETNSWVWIG